MGRKRTVWALAVAGTLIVLLQVLALRSINVDHSSALPQPTAPPVRHMPGDRFPVSPEELFGPQPASMAYRLAFPSTASTQLLGLLERLSAAVAERGSQRLPQCVSPTLVGCGEPGGSLSKGDALYHFQGWAGRPLVDVDIGQHLSLGRKERLLESRKAFGEEYVFPERMENTYYGLQFSFMQEAGVTFERPPWIGEDTTWREEILLRNTILREPMQYAFRMYADKWDRSFTERTGRELEKLSLDEWVEAAHWRWNYFTRGLADDYKKTLWLREVSHDTTERQEAGRVNDEGENSSLLQTAVKNLHTFAFFGIFDRLDESVRLFAFTYCIPLEDLQFSVRPQRADSIEEHLGRAADLVGDASYDAFVRYNRLDVLLFGYAEELFEARLQAMENAIAQGYRCKLANSSCGVLC